MLVVVLFAAVYLSEFESPLESVSCTGLRAAPFFIVVYLLISCCACFILSTLPSSLSDLFVEEFGVLELAPSISELFLLTGLKSCVFLLWNDLELDIESETSLMFSFVLERLSSAADKIYPPSEASVKDLLTYSLSCSDLISV